MPRLFASDNRTAQCPCGFGANGDKTASQVTSHRSHKRTDLCLEPMMFLEPRERDDEPRDDEPTEASLAQPTRGGVDALAAARPKSADAPNRVHNGEFTPVRTQAFIAPPLLHAYFDWFVKNGYEGDFQTWLAQLALDCLKEHWHLDFNVTITPRYLMPAGRTNGSHP